MEKNLLTDHHRNLNAATPIRFTTLSCKRQKHYAHSCSSKEPWRNHFTAIYRHRVANHNRTASNKTAHTNLKQPLLNYNLFRTRPNKPACRWWSNSPAISKHYLANHNRIASTNPAFRTMDGAITVRSAYLNSTSCEKTWGFLPSYPHHQRHLDEAIRLR